MQRTEGLGLAPPHNIYPMMDGGQTTPTTHDHEFLSATSHPGMTDSPMAQPPSMYTHISQGDKIMTPSPHPAQPSPDTPLGKPLERPFGTPIELYDQGNRRARPTVPMNTLDPEGVNNLFRRLSTRTRRSNTQRHSNFVGPSADSASYVAFGEASPNFASPYMNASDSKFVTEADVTSNSAGVEATYDPFDEKHKFDLSYLLREVYREMAERGTEQRSMGIAFRDLRVTGYGTGAQLNETFGSCLMLPIRMISNIREMMHRPVKTILQDIEGCVKPGEMLLVLGRPGSGCTSLLKALASYRDGYRSVDGTILYEGLDHRSIDGPLRGDVVYSPEDDVHFPTLTVGQTLRFATATRAPNTKYRITLGETGDRREYVDGTREVLATVLGLRHTYNTKVGNDMIRGVSGGERKRVSIAETLAARAKIALYDNSSRGLDASTALEFVTALRIQTNIANCTTIACIYQAGENITKLFDKVALLNQGYLVYFGPVALAVEYFKSIGFEPLNRQTTADFLVACTDTGGQNVNPHFPGPVPRSPKEQAQAFRDSWIGAANRTEIDNYIASMMARQTKQNADHYVNLARDERAKYTLRSSRYLLSWPMQVQLALRRRAQIAMGDMGTHITVVLAALFQALIIGSVFFQLPKNSAGFFSRGGVLFFSLLYNSFTGMSEISLCYEQRPIVIRQKRFAMLHPSADALSNTILDFPIRAVSIFVFDIIVYWMTGLNADAGRFFTYLGVTALVTYCMTSFFRMIASATKSEPLATTFGGLAVLDVALYTGYMIPRKSMKPWWKWLNYCNPVAFGFEVLLANEYHDSLFDCEQLVPVVPGRQIDLANQVCPVMSAQPGEAMVNGDRYLREMYDFSWDNRVRNSMIILAFWVFFILCFLYASNHQIDPAALGGEMQFERSKAKHMKNLPSVNDQEKALEEDAPAETQDAAEPPPTKGGGHLKVSDAVFSWDNITYDVMIKGKPRRLLNHVSGYVAPGKMTALMGESGAGKTTLLNVLAQRTDVGVVTGDFTVNGRILPKSFQADTGYCQQQDVHLAQHTVREALQFSAMLRQPRETPKEERLAYVETVIELLEMEQFADAIVGDVGQGLNVEQRKRLTIGVELAAKPSLLLFLDEPTSGLDAQAAWSVVRFLKKLASEGQAILCTIHQPSGELFNQFDRLLLLQKGGRTAYFGDLGPNSMTLIRYFEERSGVKCGENDNPAEYILDVIGAGATATTDKNWHDLFLQSDLNRQLREELAHIYATKRHVQDETSLTSMREYAQPFIVQLYEVTKRAFIAYWRNPLYIYTKLMLNFVSGLGVGSSFYKEGEKNYYIALQNRLFASFMALVSATSLSQHLQPEFIRFRGLFEVREKPSKMYTWPVMVLSALIVEIPWNLFGGTTYWLPWYYLIHFPTDNKHAGYSWGLYMLFQIYYCTFAQAMAAVSPNAMIASILFSTFFSFVVVFCGVVQPPNQMPYFWRSWMFQLSPFTWIMEGILGNAVGGARVECDRQQGEMQTIRPPEGMSCGEHMEPFSYPSGPHAPPGSQGYYVQENDGTCSFCLYRYGDDYLSTVRMDAGNKYRDLGIIVAYIAFNTALLFLLFWLFRIYRFGKNKNAKKTKTAPSGPEEQLPIPTGAMQLETPAMAVNVPHALGASVTNMFDAAHHDHDGSRLASSYIHPDLVTSKTQLMSESPLLDQDEIVSTPMSHPLEPRKRHKFPHEDSMYMETDAYDSPALHSPHDDSSNMETWHTSAGAVAPSGPPILQPEATSAQPRRTISGISYYYH